MFAMSWVSFPVPQKKERGENGLGRKERKRVMHVMNKPIVVQCYKVLKVGLWNTKIGENHLVPNDLEVGGKKASCPQ